MTDKQLLKAFERAKSDEDYINYEENQLFLEGKSSDLFAETVCKRIKLKYVNGNYSDSNWNNWSLPTSYGVVDGKLTHRSTNIANFVKDIITSYNIQKVSTDILLELAVTDFDDDYEISEEAAAWYEDKEKMIGIKELFEDCFRNVHGIGSVLLKAVKDEDETYSIDMITPLNYFPVYSQYNSRKIESYVEHMGIKCKDKKEVMFITVYEKDKHTMKFVRKVEESLETYIPSLEELEEHGFDEDFYNILIANNGEIVETYQGWAVSEIYADKGYNKVYGRSSYTPGSKTCARDIVVATTEFHQGLDMFLNPRIIMDEGFVTVSNDDKQTPSIEWRDNHLVWRSNGSEKPFFEQVKTELKRDEIDKTIASNQKQAFIELGINETSTGTTEKGFTAVASKLIDMMRVISKSSKIKSRVAIGLEDIFEFIYRNEVGGECGLKLPRTSIMTLTEIEKIDKYIKMLDSGLISQDDAIAELRGIDIEEAKEKAEVIVKEQMSKIPKLYNDEEIE